MQRNEGMNLGDCMACMETSTMQEFQGKRLLAICNLMPAKMTLGQEDMEGRFSR